MNTNTRPPATAERGSIALEVAVVAHTTGGMGQFFGTVSAARKRLVRDLERWGPAGDGQGGAWLAAAERAVLNHLSDGVPRTAAQLRADVAEVSGVIVQAP